MMKKREIALAAAAVGTPVERPVGRQAPERAGFLRQIEACRREVAQWPEWMRQERTVPAWIANHATDL
jgi:hypothetical protein